MKKKQYVAHINGNNFFVRLPIGGCPVNDTSYELNNIAANVKNLEDTFHWKHSYFLVEASHLADDFLCPLYGSAEYGFRNTKKWNMVFTYKDKTEDYWRPVLVPLNKDYLSTYQNGERIRLGTLFMNNQPVTYPINGCPQTYIPNSSLYFGNIESEESALYFIKWQDALICDRNILKGISFNRLSELGFIAR